MLGTDWAEVGEGDSGDGGRVASGGGGGGTSLDAAGGVG